MASARWIARLVLLAVIVAGLLVLLNNTQAGLSIKYHLLGDYVACLAGGM